VLYAHSLFTGQRESETDRQTDRQSGRESRMTDWLNEEQLEYGCALCAHPLHRSERERKKKRKIGRERNM
jgi:hypothetical protein